MFRLLPLTLVLFSWGHIALAGNANYGQACSIGNQKLEFGTYQFQTDCDAMTFCNSSSLCDHKGCRKDEFPFGYDKDATLPPRCDTGYFCPDEEDQCLPVLAVGSPCQFDRDGEMLWRVLAWILNNRLGQTSAKARQTGKSWRTRLLTG